MNGASTNPDVHVLAYAAAQVKKSLDIAKKMDSENFVFWGGREGYHTLLNTNVRSELDQMANFFKMVVGKRYVDVVWIRMSIYRNSHVTFSIQKEDWIRRAAANRT